MKPLRPAAVLLAALALAACGNKGPLVLPQTPAPAIAPEVEPPPAAPQEISPEDVPAEVPVELPPADPVAA